MRILRVAALSALSLVVGTGIAGMTNYTPASATNYRAQTNYALTTNYAPATNYSVGTNYVKPGAVDSSHYCEFFRDGANRVVVIGDKGKTVLLSARNHAPVLRTMPTAKDGWEDGTLISATFTFRGNKGVKVRVAGHVCEDEGTNSKVKAR